MLQLTLSKNSDINYLAKIVNIESFINHPNPKYTKLKCALVGGYKVIVGIDSNPGLYVYFPAMCKINEHLLSFANLYRHSEKNEDSEKSGFFEDNGKVKVLKLGGCLSEGFLLPIDIFVDFIISTTNKEVDIQIDTEFDEVSDIDKSFWICKKFKVRRHFTSKSFKSPREMKLTSRMIEGQFKRHYDTIILKNVPYSIQPNDLIHISSKFDGTSGISANVLCKPRKWTWFNKLGEWISNNIFQLNYSNLIYDDIFSSRNVVINDNYIGFYGKGDKESRQAAHDYLKPYLDKGITLYYELVGYTNEGSPWMTREGEAMDYGCVPPVEDEIYTIGRHCKIYIYRITYTNIDGIVHEFSPLEVETWCENRGLTHMIRFYYGIAKDLYPELPINDDWNLNFIDKIANDKNFYMELDSPDCINKVPHEGVVIKIDDMQSRAFKIKTFRHMNKEQGDLDKNISNKEEEN